MGVDEILESIAQGGSPAQRIDLYDALSRHADDDRAWERMVRALEEEPDPSVADFLLKAALRPFKARHSTLVPRLIDAFSANPEALASARLIEGCAHWVKVLPSSVLSSVPSLVRARLGWDAAPPRPPVSERLASALDALAHNDDPAAFLRWRGLEVPGTTDARKRLLDKVERRLVRMYEEGDLLLRLLAVETLDTLGAPRRLLRELCTELPRTSGTVDLVEDAPVQRTTALRNLGSGVVEKIAGRSWLIGDGVTPLSSVLDESRFGGSVWSAGRILRGRDGGTLYPLVERTDTRSKHSTPTLRLTVLRIADTAVTVEGTFPLKGVPSIANVANHILVGGHGVRCLDGRVQTWTLPGAKGREMQVHQPLGDSQSAFASDGDQLICIDVDTGSERWRANVVPSNLSNATHALAISRDGLHVCTADGVVLLDMVTGSTLDVLSADFARGLMMADGEVWLWDGTCFLNEPIVSGLSLGARRWRAGSRLGHTVTRNVNGKMVLFSDAAARWDGGGTSIDWPLGIGIGGVGEAIDTAVLLGAGSIRPMPWAWFELPIS